jgi:hypothetical protein
MVAAIAGLFFGPEAVRGSLLAQFRSLLGESGSQAVEDMLKGAESSTSGGWAAVVGIALLVIPALGVVVQLKDALNTIFEVKKPEDAGVAWYAKGLRRVLRRHDRPGFSARGIAHRQRRPRRLLGLDQRLGRGERFSHGAQLCCLARRPDAAVQVAA